MTSRGYLMYTHLQAMSLKDREHAGVGGYGAMGITFLHAPGAFVLP